MGRIRWALGLTSIVVFCVAAPAQADILPAGQSILPVGQWDLNEGTGNTAQNDTTRSANGTLGGGVTWTNGRFAGGLAFNGTNGAVDVPASAALEPASVTVSAWVQSAGTPGAYKYIAVKGGNGCCTGSYGLYTGVNSGLEFYVASSATTYVVSPDAGPGVWDGKWHNVIGTFDGASVRLYVDGRQIGSGSADSAPIQYQLPTSDHFVIGNYPWCAGLGFSGNIDEVKVFNRALGPTEIALVSAISQALPSSAKIDLVY
jgi:hypothetical protein